MRIGFAGFSQQLFDVDKAKVLVKDLFDHLEKTYGDFEVVSGLTNQGIPALIYAEGTYRNLRLVGIACGKVESDDYDKFPVDEEIIVGESWGDESQEFIDNIDMLIAIGGGPQTKKEMKMAEEADKEVLFFEPDQEFDF